MNAAKLILELKKQYNQNEPEYIQAPMELIKNPDGTQSMRSQGLIHNPKYVNINDLAQKQAEEEFKNQRALAMRNTFVSNVGILLGPNAIMHKAIWGKAAQKFEKTTDSALKRVGKSASRIGSAFASEGFWEEGSQSTVENMYVNKAMNNKLGKGDDYNIGDFAREYVNTLNTTDGQKAIFLGGALGGPMMSHGGRKEDVINRKYTNSVLSDIDAKIDYFNGVFEGNSYKTETKPDGTVGYIYKKDKEGNDTTEREIDKVEVAKIIKSLNL